MRKSKATNYLFLVLVYLFTICPTSLFSQITVDKFMGANTRAEDPIARMKAVGFIREYHPWYYNEGNPTTSGEGFSPSYPNALYRWNTAYEGTTYAQIDDFYQKSIAAGLTINPTFLGNIFQIVDPTITGYTDENGKIQEQQPRVPTADSLSPASYIAHGAYLYHYAARYGQTTFSTKRFNDLIVPVTHPKETPLTGLGQIEYMESWNEQDKTWWQAEYPATYFSPEVYSAMLSADYDGHNQTLGLVQDPDNASQMISTIGIKNADPNMKVVIGGLATANLDYFRDMVSWAKTNRPANAAHGQIPFDVLNIHHYVGNGADFGSHTHGISPEQAGLQPFLQTFSDYRDSLNLAENLNLELWLSEFGYDTYDNSSLAPQTIVAPPIGTNSIYEVQGQWLVRTYLAAAAADIDRAMMYDLRDVIGQPGLFARSGLLEDVSKNYKPKNSWFYVYTMKNVLTDMVFENTVTIDPAQVVDPGNVGYADSTYIYKFKDPNGSKTVYAIWSGTSSDKTYDVNFNIESAAGGALVQLELPSIWGVQTAIPNNTPTISISERPVFLILHGNYFTPQTSCTAPVAENPTCSSMNVRLNAPNNGGTYQLWYMEGNLTPQDFSHPLASLVNELVTPNDSVITVGNLNAATEYTFFLIPEGVGESEVTKICTATNTTLAETSTCYLDVQTSWIYNDLNNTIGVDPYTLFDEQTYGNSICLANPPLPNTIWGFNGADTLERSVSVDLQAYYYIDLFTLHDQYSEGFFTIQIADSPNGPWTTAHVYQTTETNSWVQITNAIPAGKPVRYLKFIAEKENRAKIGELLICGRLSNFNPDILPGVATNGDISCDTSELTWNHPFDDDISGYKVIDDVTKMVIETINFTVGMQTYQLPTNNQTASFAIVTIDNANQESIDSLKINSAALDRISDCQIPLNTAMIFDHFNKLTNAQRLVDEQSGYDPICNPDMIPTANFWGLDYPSNGVKEHVSLNLGNYYFIDRIIMHDGMGQNGHIDILAASSPNGPWTTIISHDAVIENGWVTFENPIPNNSSVRYLRFEASADNQVNVGELFICGTLHSNHNPNIAPGAARFGQVTNLSCTEATLAWVAPFDEDIAQYQVYLDGNLAGSTSATDLSLNNLIANTNYVYKIVTEDLAGNESTDSLTIEFTTNMQGECNLICNLTCTCAICVRPSWMTSLNPTSNFEKNNLFDEQDKVPFCGAGGNSPSSTYRNTYSNGGGNNNAPDTVLIDLQEVHDISTIHVFFQSGNNGNFIIQYLNSSNSWLELINHVTAPDYSWKPFPNLDTRAQHLRIIQTDDASQIGEIGICGVPFEVCLANLDLPNPITTSDTMQAGIITSSAIIGAGIQVGYTAENHITLTPGFHAQSNSNFIAKIAACQFNFTSPEQLPTVAKINLPTPPTQKANKLKIYPNPSRDQTTLTYQLATAAKVKLDIYDTNGQIIQTLINNQLKDQGIYETNFQPAIITSGFYVAVLRVGKEVLVEKLVLLNK